MITLRHSGPYELAEAQHGTKLLYLDNTNYAWMDPLPTVSLLILTHYQQTPHTILKMGTYRLYTVINESGLVNTMHLELGGDNDAWNGYLLPENLPTVGHFSCRIVATNEVITHNPTYRERPSDRHSINTQSPESTGKRS